MTNGRLPNRTRKKSNLMAYLSQVKLGVEQHHLSITSGPRDRHKNYPAFRICGAREKVTQIQIFRRPTASFHEYHPFELPYHTASAHTTIAHIYANMASSNTLTLTADEIDDVLYFTRVNEASDLQATITELAQKYNRAPREIVEAAVDSESGNGALHYCAANGLAGTWKSGVEIAKGRGRRIEHSATQTRNHQINC